jgi:short subunit dehydrogenase-like uncharacterized protein
MAREFDLVLLGPTGYTGKFTAEYLYKAFPTTLKWALAGRSASKIEGVLKEIQAENVGSAKPGELSSCQILFFKLTA